MNTADNGIYTKNNYVSYYNVYKYKSASDMDEMGHMRGPKRVMAFFILTAFLPAALIITPLYLRHVVFADVRYPVAESDILTIVDGISSIFCDRLTLRMNSTFNAFKLIGNQNRLSQTQLKHIRLKKSMTLPDDTLEYWGFYLLKGSLVKLKVCSRYQGSRILVVRGEKILNTCGLLEHNYNLRKTGDAHMDFEHNQVKVTFENAAEEIRPSDESDENGGGEDLTGENVDLFMRKRLKNTSLSLENRPKRNVALDAHIAHGGNNEKYNSTNFDEESSASSFETDLLTCYDGQILLTQGFPPSHLCNDVHYLERTKHMVTSHQVGSDGYYYYIFYSDNDLYKNDIHAIFDIYKPTFRFANNSMSCLNQTECSFGLNFWSDDPVVVEVPTRDGIEGEDEDSTMLVSTCHPRMGVYAFFPIAVLFLILVCAFL